MANAKPHHGAWEQPHQPIPVTALTSSMDFAWSQPELRVCITSRLAMSSWAALQVRVPRHPKIMARMETGKHRWDLGYPQGRTGQGEQLSSLGLVSVRGVRMTSYFWSGRQAENPI